MTNFKLILGSFIASITLGFSFIPKLLNTRTSKVIVEQNISYGSHEMQKLDLCKPKDFQGNVPGVMLIHGGGGDKKSFLNSCKKLAENGFVAITVNFQETPAPSYKVVLSDNRKALAWLKSSNKVDGEKIGVMGGSLGGYVASMAGTGEFKDKVDCVVNNFGPTDFTDENWEYSPWKDEFIEKFFGGVTYEDDPELYKNLSPITHVSENDALSWLFTRSTNDPLIPRSQMTRMIDALNSNGKETEFYEYDGKGGGHSNKLPLWKARKLFNKRVNFLTNCLSS